MPKLRAGDRLPRQRQAEERDELQQRLLEANPGWLELGADALPDGDSDLPADLVAGFRIVGCRPCGGAPQRRRLAFNQGSPT